MKKPARGPKKKHYRLLVVRWKDHWVRTGWHNLKDIDDARGDYIISVGTLMKETDEVYVLASMFTAMDAISNPAGNAIQCILKSDVLDSKWIDVQI